jgi:DNA-binding MarR family transcriptional regulator
VVSATRLPRVLRALAAAQAPLSIAALASSAGIDPSATGKAVATLRRRELVLVNGSRGRRLLVTLTDKGVAEAAKLPREVPPPPASETRRKLPVAQTGHLVPGPGERRECASYDDCLDAFLSAYRTGQDAHCPRACRWHEEPPRERATDYAGSGRSNYEAAAFNVWGAS